MSRKHYVALAAALKDSHERIVSIQEKRPVDCGDALNVMRWTAHHIANVCAADNPRFDRARFLAACGMES